MISHDTFRLALEEAIKIKRPVRQFRLRRALRNPRKLRDAYREVTPKIYAGVVSFDFDTILQWILDNWAEVLKMLLSVLLFLI